MKAVRFVMIGIFIFLLGLGFGQQYRFGYVVQDLGNQYWVSVAEGVQDKAAELGIEVVVLDARTDAARQLSNVEDLILQGIDALLLSPWDAPSGGTAVEAANRADIPVFVLDIGVTHGEVASFLVSDNYEGGVMAGEYMIELLGGEGRVALIQTQLGYEIPALRGEGFEDTVTAAGIEVVARQPADSQRALGLTVMENYLQTYPDLDGVFAYNDEMALGAVEAIHNANRQDQIRVIGFDAIGDAVEAIRQGRLAATVAQQPYLLGQMGVEVALAYLSGEEVEAETYIDVMLITPENVDEIFPR